MSIQIFLQGRLLGMPEFLAMPPQAGGGASSDIAGSGSGGTGAAADPESRTSAERFFAGRCAWISLLSEVLPRALLAEFGLSKILLGSSGGGQFLVVLPKDSESRADEFLGQAAAEIHRMSSGHIQLLWAATENLGDWAVVRKRLREAMALRRGTPAAALPQMGCESDRRQENDSYFRDLLGFGLIEQRIVGWSPENPARILLNEGKYTWMIGSEPDQILLTRHVALSDDGSRPVDATELAARAEGCRVWGILRGDADNLDVRFRRVTSIEEHVQLSVLYKQFFAGELEVLCSLPDFWRKVTILYSGGDDFAAYGTWDALIQLARELQRLFRRFSEESLKDYPGGEGKTITMSLALARHADASVASLFDEAGRMLEQAKSSSRDSFSLLGRILEWRHVNGAAELKDTMVRVAQEFGGNTQFLRELSSFYRDEIFSPAHASRKKEGELEKPWRLHRRVLRVLPSTRDRELDRLRSSLIVELVGKNASQVKLRPAGRVALEWARLLTEA